MDMQNNNINKGISKSSDYIENTATKKPNTKTKIKKRKRKIGVSKSIIPTIDLNIEEKLRISALRNKLTDENVLQILRKVVGNDHVLAIVHLQEEEQQQMKLKKIQQTMEDNSDKQLVIDLNNCNERDSKNCKTDTHNGGGNDDDGDDDDEDEDDNEVTPPKLTRSRARDLNITPLKTNLTFNKSSSEIEALINQELHSDDEDEEYQPNYDEILSDDEHNTTISDIDSQPRTPQTPRWTNTLSETVSPSKFPNDDIIFKKPHDYINDPIDSHITSSPSLEHESIIAKRTRSKVSLTTTPIETIESTFIPPDITTDMYDFDSDMDNVWLEFLSEFTKPLNHHTNEEDDEADPEYIGAEKVPIDKEELREVRVPRKEVIDLVSEFYNHLANVDLDAIDNPPLSMMSYEHNQPTAILNENKSPTKINAQNNNNRLRKNANTNSSTATNSSANNTSTIIQNDILQIEHNLITTTDCNVHKNSTYISESQMNIPKSTSISSSLPHLLPPQYDILYPTNSRQETMNNTSSQSTSTTLNMTFDPNFVSTPMKSSSQLNNPLPGNYQHINSTLSNNFPTTNQYPFQHLIASTVNTSVTPQTTITTTTTPVLIPYNISINGTNGNLTSSLINNVPSTNGFIQLPAQYQQIILNVPAINQLQEFQQQEQLRELKRKRKKYRLQLDLPERDNYGKKRRIEYDHLVSMIPVKPTFNNVKVGFTQQQMDILNQQLRMHTQLATQSFLQTYGHPVHWKNADQPKKHLLELNDIVQNHKYSVLNVINLKPAISLITKWEDELSVSNSENTKHIEFLHRECESAKLSQHSNYRYTMNFPVRVMNLMINSNVFMYPRLLPKIPFSIRTPNYIEFISSEDYLIASCLETFFEQLYKERSDSLFKSNRTPKLLEVCTLISRYISPFRTAESIFKHVCGKKKLTTHCNPIQYYFLHKVAPNVQHILEPIEFVAPNTRTYKELPFIWAKFLMEINAVNDKDDTTKSQNNSITDQNLSTKDIADTTDVEKTIDNVNNVSSTKTCNSTNKTVVLNYTNELGDNISINVEVPEFVSNKSVPLTNSNYYCKNKSPTNTISDILLNSTEKADCTINDQLIATTSLPALVTPIKSCEIQLDSVKSSSKKRQTLLTDYFPSNKNTKPASSTLTVTYQHKTSALKHLSKRKRFSRNHLKIRRYTKKCTEYLTKLQKLSRHYFYRNVKHHKLKQYQQIDKLIHNRNLLNAYICFETINIYVNLIKKHYTMSSSKRLKFSDDHIRRFNITQNMDDAADDRTNDCTSSISVNTESSSIIENTVANPGSSQGASTKRIEKIQKTCDYCKLLNPESKEETMEKDIVFAQNFMDKVEETFLADNQDEKLQKFRKILQNFNPETDKATDLYYLLEHLFLPNYPELSEIFLTFLLPGDAIQIGKFVEHFMLTNLTNFINKLHIYFNKQPAQIRKIMNCLNELSNESDLEMERIKTKIMPLLKSNQLLLEWFIQCFPDAPIPECPEKSYETLIIRKHTQMTGTDTDNVNDSTTSNTVTTAPLPPVLTTPSSSVSTINDTTTTTTTLSVGNNENTTNVVDSDLTEFYEEIPINDILPDPIENPCQLRYINNGIYYGNRGIVLPAKLSFYIKCNSKLGKDENGEICDIKSEDNVSTISNEGYVCVHNIKQYGEKKLREYKLHTELETPIGSISCNNDEMDVNNANIPLVTDRQNEIESSDEKASKRKITTKTINHDEHNSLEHNTYDDLGIQSCDEKTLRAHSIRLNPIVHASEFYKSSEMLDLLSSSSTTISTISVPSTTVPTSMNTSSNLINNSIISNVNVMDNARNFGTINKTDNNLTSTDSNSDNDMKHTLRGSPKKQSNFSVKRTYKSSTIPFNYDADNKIIPATPASSSSSLTQYKNGKKVKFKLADHHQKQYKITADSKNHQHKSKKRKDKIKKDDRTKVNNDEQLNAIGNIVKPEHEKISEIKNESFISNESVNINIVHPITWTRDEDKIILEQLKSGFNSETELYESLEQKLPERTSYHIIERVKFLLDFLNKLQSQ